MEIISQSVKDTLNIAKKIAKNLQKGDIICLFGELGSGKTVFTKGLASGLGIKPGEIISPTFVLIRQYEHARLPLYHFDLYRLKAPEEIASLGYEEYFYGTGVSVIEWADKLNGLMPKEYLGIKLEVFAEGKRKLRFIPCGERYRKTYEDIRH